MLDSATIELLKELDDNHRPHKDAFYKQTAAKRPSVFDLMKRARDRRLEQLFSRSIAAQSGAAVLSSVATLVCDYASRSDWALLDLVALASSLPQPGEEIALSLAPTMVAYHALRMLDDVIDGHHDYKGRFPTLLGRIHGLFDGRGSEAACNLLPLLLMVFDSAHELTSEGRAFAERTLMGMLDEAIAGDITTLPRYRQMTEGKMVSYGMLLYAPALGFLDPASRRPVSRFLRLSFFLAQIINDLQDREEDRRRHQINFWNLPLGDEAKTVFMLEFMRLSASCAWIDLQYRGYAHARVTDLAGYALQIIAQAQESDGRDATRALGGGA
jgi:hypothetical protein